jgi:hypothetical protein
VKRWISPEQFIRSDGVICLTAEAIEPHEFDAYIDELIDQLQALKGKGRRALAAIDKKEKLAPLVKRR